MPKFNLGQKLKCIEGNNTDFILDDNNRGHGWERDYVYIIKDISKPGNNPYVYWDNGGQGVYEPFLELVNEDWDE